MKRLYNENNNIVKGLLNFFDNIDFNKIYKTTIKNCP